MKFFVDSADPSQIRACAERRSIHGVSIGTSSGVADRAGLIQEICGIFKGPVSVNVSGEDGDQILREARGLARIAPQIVIRLSLHADGLKVLRACAAEGIKTHGTGCLSAVQGLQAGQAGAAYVSPLGDRPDDPAGLDLARKLVALHKTYGVGTEVLMGPLRSAGDVAEAALAGAQIATVPFPLLRQLLEQLR
jgi:transaldolase